MGDVATGFYLGGTYELMNIGLNPLGGSTVPNYNMGVVVGVAFGAVTNMETRVWRWELWWRPWPPPWMCWRR